MFSRFALLALLSVAVYSQSADDVPPFLASASDAVKQSFFTLLQTNEGSSETQINSAVDKWVSNQSSTIQQAYKAFKGDLEKYQKEEAAAHAAAVAKFSPAAKQADAKLSQIAAQSGLSFDAKQKQITAFIDSLPANVKAEIMGAMGQQ